MKIDLMPASRDDSGGLQMEITIGEGASARQVNIPLGLSEEQSRKQLTEPVVLDLSSPNRLFLMYRDRIAQVTDFGSVSEELVVRVKHRVLTAEKVLEKLRRQVEAYERFEKSAATPRVPIPDDVRMFVWHRDNGKCVRCGSGELLEFDHIIPLAKGGSNTDRNIQLLCENCNRSKGAQII